MLNPFIIGSSFLQHDWLGILRYVCFKSLLSDCKYSNFGSATQVALTLKSIVVERFNNFSRTLLDSCNFLPVANVFVKIIRKTCGPILKVWPGRTMQGQEWGKIGAKPLKQLSVSSYVWDVLIVYDFVSCFCELQGTVFSFFMLVAYMCTQIFF